MFGRSIPHINFARLSINRRYFILEFCVPNPKTMSNLTENTTPTMDLDVELFNKINVYVFTFPLNTFGIITNIINMAVFCKMGLKDGVSVSMVALFVADFFFLLSTVYRALRTVIPEMDTNPDWLIKPRTVGFLVDNYFFQFYFISTLLTTYISIARCLCVALPFRFQQIFTMNQARVVVTSIYVYAVVTKVPNMITTRFKWEDTGYNTSQLVFEDNTALENVEVFEDLVNRTIIPFSCLGICILCLIVLFTKLVSAAKFRASSTSGHGPGEGNEKSAESGSKKGNVLGPKDIQLMKSVFFICLVFVFSSSTIAAVAIGKNAVPEFRARGAYGDLYRVSVGLMKTCMTANCAINFIIFYTFNRTFRKVFLRMIRRSTPAIQ